MSSAAEFRLRIPSKTFLAGEYGVLQGHPAMVLLHEPFFSTEPGQTSFHPESPVAKIAGANQNFSFLDPHRGAGGFGGSGAEVVAALAHREGKQSFTAEESWRVRDLYLQHAPGSGYDVAAQSFGMGKLPGLAYLQSKERMVYFVPPRHGWNVHIFRTGKKVLTHEHKAEIPAGLGELTHKVMKQVRPDTSAFFLDAITEFRNALRRAGLEAPHTRAAVDACPTFAKGCGAMGADVIVAIAHKPADYAAWARDHSLVEVARVPI